MSYLSQNLHIKTYMSALRKVEAESGVSAMKITFRPRRPLFELHRQLFKKQNRGFTNMRFWSSARHLSVVVLT
jgi:hypothetical protein